VILADFFVGCVEEEPATAGRREPGGAGRRFWQILADFFYGV